MGRFNPKDLGIGELFERIRDAVIVADAKTQQIMLWNQAATNIFGYSASEALGLSAEALVPRHLKEQLREGMARYNQTGGGPYIDSSRLLELPALKKGGEKIYVELSASPIDLEDNADGDGRFVLAIVRDITERKGLEKQLAYRAVHDPLTNLPNRALFIDRLQHALTQASRRKGGVAVLFMDLDNFKLVNDSLGHQVGDRLLVAVAERLSTCVGPEDTVARFSGDEFAFLLESIVDKGDVLRLAERIMQGLQAPFNLGEYEMFITTSIGITLSTPGQENLHLKDFLRNADVALYEAKNRGKNRYAFYEARMRSRAWDRLQLENELRRAVNEGQFQIYYQPEVLLETSEIFGVEALVRWEHPERGLVLPEEFVPLAEETGLILPIGKWVLEEACRQAIEWGEQHSEVNPPLNMSVNLSVLEVQQPSLASEIAQVLEAAGLDASSLLLEITESVVMEDARSLIETLEELKTLGVGLVIDDFGTGYSSLEYLKRLPADYLKVDGSFVRGLEDDPKDTAITKAIIDLAHNLGLKTIAEGVETEEQLRRLKVLGCELAQGSYFSDPLSAAHISEMLAAGPTFSPQR